VAEWTEEPLLEQDLHADPLQQFETWFRQATNAQIPMPEAAAVATSSADGRPSVRMVLVKQFDARGFVFYTNYESRKADELQSNPRAALLFYWGSLGRQVRIEGPAERTSIEESVAYARSRPRNSQLSALASAQSHAIESREALEQRVAELAAEYDGRELPVSEIWGGFRVVAVSFEFWQQRADRLHDRLVYTRTTGGEWRIERLGP